MKKKPFLPSLLSLGVLFFLIALVSTICPAQPVSRETARQAAKTFLDNNGASSAELADVSAAAGFDHLYVFTTDKSFVLMAADSRVQPVLGYSLNGPFETEDMPDNKRAWIQEYSDGIQYAIEHQTRASAETSRHWRDLLDGDPNAGRATTVVGPLIRTQWNQGSPYNLLCPSGSVTGCVATAMAQVMKYWNYPEHGIGSHSYVHSTYGELSADFQNTTYDWANMSNTYGNSSTQAQKMAVATLMYHCGVSVNMNYSPNASGAGSAIVAEALKTYFNYSSEVVYHDRSGYDDDVWIGMLKADLDLERPIWYCGSGSGGGHAFVFDGYNSNDYFHVNWGWGGYCDEYYVITNLNPGPGGIGSGSNGIYNDGQGAVIGIHPSECAANAPTNLTYTQSGRSVTLTWDAANGAVSYNVYCNNNFVDNTTATTYVHLAPFGNTLYYVRSVDADGEMSLSSNEVTVEVDYQTPTVTDLTASTTGNDALLSWTAPEWCYPETPTVTLNYGEGPVNYSWTVTYYAHRHLAADLAQYAGKAVYKVSTFIQYPGTYSLYVYTGAVSSGNNYYVTDDYLAFADEGVSVTVSNSWYDFELSTPIILTGDNDLWVIVKQENTGANYPVPSFDLSPHNINAFYMGLFSNNRLYLGETNSNYNCAWLINTYLTDGVYTYNLYRDGSVIAGPIDGTQYTDSGLEDGTYAYYVKTNYYGGETEASNTVTVTIPGLSTQTVTLNEGWTWWTPTVATTLAQLEAALGDNGIIINSQESGFARYEVVDGQGSWSGTLQGFVPGQMYRIETQTAGTITLTGETVPCDGFTFMPGYNWFGYTGRGGLSITEAIGFAPSEGDQIIGENGTATYNNSNGWSGDFTELVPGHGYIYFSTDNQTKMGTLQ